MENFDSLVISLLDSDAMKGCFKKELCEVLDVPIECITDIWLKTILNDGVISQEICVAFVDAKIKKKNLVKLPFKHIYENCIVFEVGDSIL
ncbi:MAG: hypothetical protein J6Y78_04575 [Paludibacteraceae bacterium]|nr:hypothetical protein [Paludibacteraceae bacterium]